MKLLEQYQKILLTGINITELIAYTISFLLISIGIIRAAIQYIIFYINPKVDDLKTFKSTRLSLGESSALALSFILGVEILKLFYIKSYKQLVIVSCLVIIKLLVNYFLIKEITQDKEKILNFKYIH
jgi:uncharacterized membrane protein